MLQAVILAGGQGTRVRHLFPDIPKALIPIGGKPFLEHQLILLQAAGVTEVVLCLGHRAEAVITHFGERGPGGVKLVYSVEDRPLGTGGALRLARPYLTDSFLLLYGDSYLPTDYTEVAAIHQARGTLGLMVVYRNESRLEPSNTAIADGFVTAYEKGPPRPEMCYIDWGLSALKREALDLLPPGDPADLSTLTVALIARRQLAALETSQRFYEVGSPDGIAALTAYLASLKGTEGDAPRR